MSDTRSGMCDAVHNAVRSAVQEQDPNLFVSRAVVIYEFVDAEGKRKLSVWPSEDARWWDVQGMAHYALSIADAVISHTVAMGEPT